MIREATGGALEGLLVVDLTQHLAGPYCTQLLADQGATVVKIEPWEGDGNRRNGPFRADDNLRAYGGYFQSINRNKLGIVLDLKTPEGQAIVKRLVTEGDVVAENYRAGVMERLGLPYETLRELNPRLVYAAIRGFGDPRTGKSPYHDWPAYDVVSQAMGGIMGITGPDPDTPLKVGPGVGDIFPATLGAFGILAAVYRARETGKGQFVDVSMVDGVLALCERIVYQYSYQGRVPGPEGNGHPILSPFGLFPAKDGWVSIAGHTDRFWRELTSAMGRPELAEDQRFCNRDVRLQHAEELTELLSAWTRRHSKHELTGLLGGKVPFGPVHTVDEIFADPHFTARNMLASVEQPGSAEPVQIANTPVHMTETNGGVRRRAPLLGEHTDAVLGGLGYSPTEIGAFRAAKVVR